VTGPKDILETFIEKAKGTTDDEKQEVDLLCFNNFVSVPAGLLARSYGGEVEEKAGNVELIDGYKCRYDWEHANWGTKWGACDTVFERRGDDDAFYGFQSAWSPPIEWMKKVVAMPEFAMLQFELSYGEYGMGFTGTATSDDGELIDAYSEDAADIKEFFGAEDDEG